MYSFKNDYSQGAHPNILKSLIETNLVQQTGYGEDEYSLKAKDLIKEKINNPTAEIHLVSGGTQANLLVISSILRTHEAVISAKTGHIYANEAGAIELTGHRVITVETTEGKLLPSDIQKVVNEHLQGPHVVKPKMVYISNSTEIGTIYTKSELENLSVMCKSLKLFLFLDGARLGHALTAKNSDLTLDDISRLTDVFYIGGTKNGALLGEAIVFNNVSLAQEFGYILKQRGALLAKGRLLGIQFLELFKDDLYFTLAETANGFAAQIVEAIRSKGYSFLTESTTNQIFPILPKTFVKELEQKYAFHVWKEMNAETVAIRLVTSWETDQKMVDNLIQDIRES